MEKQQRDHCINKNFSLFEILNKPKLEMCILVFVSRLYYVQRLANGNVLCVNLKMLKIIPVTIIFFKVYFKGRESVRDLPMINDQNAYSS